MPWWWTPPISPATPRPTARWRAAPPRATRRRQTCGTRRWPGRRRCPAAPRPARPRTAPRAGQIREAVVDTSGSLGKAAGRGGLGACHSPAAEPDSPEPAEWFDLLPRTPVRPDTRHRFRIDPVRSHLATHVRLEIHPDGGMARLRLFGELTGDGRASLGVAWFDRLPEAHAVAVLAADCGLAGPPAPPLAAQRPYQQPEYLDALLSGGELPGVGAA